MQTARIDIREVLGSFPGSDMGGLTLSFPNLEGISASQIVFDEVNGLAAIMKLFERDKDESVQGHVFRAPMIALRQPDAALAYPKDTVLNPRLLLRNAGQNSLPVSAVIQWRSQNAEGTYNYPALNLKSNEVSVIDLGLLQDSGAIPADANWSNVALSYTGKDADLVPVAVSYDSKQRYGLQSPFTEGTNRLFKGGMWHVDSTHNSLITTGNGGSATTKAEVILFYNGGQSRYRIEKILAPGDQLLLNVGQLIRNQVPDSDGNVIPPEIMSGSYELRDLDHPAVGLLYEGKLTIDKTYGHASYGCGNCCGLYDTKLMPNPYNGPPSVYNQDSYLALEQCGGQWEDWTGTAYSWQSTNTSVATLPNSMLHTVAPGTATGSAQNLLQATHPAPRCPQAVMGGYQPVTVVPQLTVTGNAYIFVGSDPAMLSANKYFATTATPPGGAFSASSSNPADTFSYGSTSGVPWVSITTPTQSTNPSDRTLSFTYTVNSASATQTMKVTARQIAYATNPNPTNTCSLGHGTSYSILYTVYTHPDKNAVNSQSDLQGTVVLESFTPTKPCNITTGNGNINVNGQFTDNIAYCSTSPLVCTGTTTQSLTVGGFGVRTNTLTLSSGGISYTSNGPTQ